MVFFFEIFWLDKIILPIFIQINSVLTTNNKILLEGEMKNSYEINLKGILENEKLNNLFKEFLIKNIKNESKLQL
jgi:hypothetical protein